MSASPLIIDIVSLHQKPGTVATIEVALAKGDRRAKLIDELVLAGSDVQAKSIGATLEFESRGQQMNVSGPVAVLWQAPCRRCLEPTEGQTVVEVNEIFHVHPNEGEMYPLGEHELDLTPMLREAVLLNLPLNPICDQMCTGPEPQRFPTTVESDEKSEGEAGGAGGSAEKPVDPRWGPLSELKFD